METPRRNLVFRLFLLGPSDQVLHFSASALFDAGECIGGIVGIDMQRYHLFGKLIHELELLESLGGEDLVKRGFLKSR